jgi:hypothetical protein
VKADIQMLSLPYTKLKSVLKKSFLFVTCIDYNYHQQISTSASVARVSVPTVYIQFTPVKLSL